MSSVLSDKALAFAAQALAEFAVMSLVPYVAMHSYTGLPRLPWSEQTLKRDSAEGNCKRSLHMVRLTSELGAVDF